MNNDITKDGDESMPADKVQSDVCAKCKKNPCVCPGEKPKRTKPPKISWL